MRRRQSPQHGSSISTKDAGVTTASATPESQTATGNRWIFHSTLEFHQRTVRCVAFCPLSSSCALAAASFDGTVTIWEHNKNDTWECTTQLEGHENEVKCVTWNATGSLLATCGRDKTVWIWETYLDGSLGGSMLNEVDNIAVLNGHEGDVKSIRFAPSHGIWGDGDEILLSASYDDTIRVWGSLIVQCNCNIFKWNTTNLGTIHAVHSHYFKIQLLFLFTLLVFLYFSSYFKNKAEDDGDWYCACSIQDVHTDTIWSIAVAPGGGRVISASADGSLAIYKSYTPAERKELFPDDDNNNHGSFKCVGLLSGAHPHSSIYSIDYAPAKAGHGRVVSGGDDSRIQIYREIGITSDKPIFTIDVAIDTDHGDVNCVCWHPQDGSILCSVGDDGTVRIWHFELETNKQSKRSFY